MDWWCEQSTVGAGPKTAAARCPGTVSTVDVAEDEGRAAVSQMCPITSGRCWCRVPPSSTLSTWQPRQMASTGRSAAQGRGQQRPLAGVADGVDPAHLWIGFLAVGAGVDVAAAAEHQTVEHGDDLVGTRARALGRAAGRGHQQGPPTGGGHQFEVVLGQHGRPARPRCPSSPRPRRWRRRSGGSSLASVQRGWTLAAGATNMAPHARPRAHRPRNRRRIRRHRHRCLPRHVRAPGGQAGHGRLLDLPRRRARDRGLRLPARRRRRHEPAARATPSPTGTPATATSSASRTSPRPGGSRGSRARPWSSAT